MSTSFAKHTSVHQTPATEFIPGREKEMAKNNAGGAVFTLSPFQYLSRFLILGTEGGTYYATEREHTLRSFEALRTCIHENARQTVDLAVNVSIHGRAAKNDAALFVIAAVMAFADNAEDKYYARCQLQKVARTGTHILHFAEFVNQFKGWGTGTRKAFQNWFLEKSAEEIAFQALKYKSRDGWSMRDLLRKSHPIGSADQNAVFHYITKNKIMEGTPEIISIVDSLPSRSAKEVANLITDHRLPREVIPTEMLNNKIIWEALLPHMNLTAMIRNLGKMTSLKMLDQFVKGSNAEFVISKLSNMEELRKARIHPLNVLTAFKTYAAGRGFKGSLSWSPNPTIVEALQEAFTKSFDFVEPSGKNVLIALDVSGSMATSKIANSYVSPREASAVMAMVTVRAEPKVMMTAFSRRYIPLDIQKSDNYHQVMTKISGLPFDHTDCSLPMVEATESKLEVDVFQIYTDNETWVGNIKPSQALVAYRKKLNRPHAKLAVVGMTATHFTIADPKDPLMMDVVGFDTGAPAAMAEFAKM